MRAELRFAGAVVLTGLAAGLSGSLLTLLLHAVQHVAFGYTENTFIQGVQRAGALRRVLAVGVGGALAGLGWLVHRRSLLRRADTSISVTRALAADDPRMPVVATTTDAMLQILAVGAGGSIGREGAPRQVGAALAAALGRLLRLDPAMRRLLLAAGAGARLAAVYNVPLGGAAFAVEVLLRTVRLRPLLTALATSAIATVVAWPLLGTRPTYLLPHPGPSAHALIVVTAVAPLLGILVTPLGLAFRAATTWARTSAPDGWRAVVATTATFTALGATAIAFPELLGNGKGLAELDFAAPRALGAVAAVSLLKPLATAACLRSGAIGGLLTPSFATGATVGLLAADLWGLVWGPPSGVGFSLVCAAAMLAVTQRAPVTAVVLAAEFAHPSLALLPALVLAVAATLATRRGSSRVRRWFVARRGDRIGAG